jgi:tetratricopeptide (TPR) repeat protein
VVVLGLYLVLVGIFTYDWKTKVRALDLTLIALVSAVVAHFVEIQFGIAIASTRTHFWLFAALIVVAGRLMDDEAEPATATAVPAAAPERTLPASAPAARPQVAAASFSKKKNKQVAAGRPRQDTRPAHRPAPARGAETDLGALIRRVMPSALPLAVVGGLILATMAYDFMLPPNTNQAPSRTTSVQFWLYFITWISCGLVVALDGVHEVGRDQVNERIASLIVYTAVSLLMWVGYVGLRSIVLSMSGAQIDPLALVSVFYLAVLLFGLLLAAALYAHDRPTVVTGWSGPAGGMIYAIAAVVGVIFIVFTNVNMVLADVQYKTGLAYDNAQRYDGSIQAYQSAIRLTPGQDFYYLFLGRSFMELARQFPERTATPPYNAKTESPLALARERLATLGRADMISASLVVLETARDLNVLNTDHYANLARLHRFWGETGDRAKFETADSYFRDATDLSPNNAQLWNEWAIVSILRGLPDDAEAKLNRSLELDDRYDLTYYYQGNLYMNLGEGAQDNDLRLNYLTRAADAYGACLTVTPTYWECAKARGYINGKYLGRSQEAVADFLLVAGSLPRPEDVARITNATDRQRVTQELININQNLAITYGQLGQFSLALQHAQIASNLAPQDQALKALVEQLKAQQK